MKLFSLKAIFVLVTAVFMTTASAHAGPTTVNLGTADPFAILSGTPNITDSPTSTIIGNVGMSPAASSGIGLLCTQVTGTIYAIDGTGNPCFTVDAPLVVAAKSALTAAYLDAAGRTPVTTVPTELGGTTKIAGVYVSNATDFAITAGAGPLVIDGQGDSSSVFIFNAPASSPGLTVGSGSVVQLVNGAQACNIFWRVDSAAINTTAVFKGNILALNSITVANGANIEGRLLARNGNVTLINDTITIANCAAVPGLPDTSSDSPNTSWGIVTMIVGITLLSFVLSRSKRAD